MSDLFSGIANLTKTVTDTLNSYEVRKISDKVQSYVMNYTEPEVKVRDATTEEPWGPTPDMMREIAGLTFQYDAFPEVMGMLWKRMLPPSPVAWRHTYKSLILLENLLKNGCERVISNARDHAFEMRSLEHYKCIDERGKDQGINVRFRVKNVLNLLEDDDLLRNERRKAKLAGKDDKYRGFSRDEMNMRGYSGSSFGNSSSGNKFNSKKSNFDNDIPYDKDNRFDDELSEGNREVTAFDFGGHKREASPELGFPAESPVNNDDDDGFGDFASARTNNPTVKTAKTDDSFADFGDFKTSLPSPPISRNSIPSVPPPPGLSAHKSTDFFSSSVKPAKQTVNDDFDFFATSNTAQAKPVIAPPSGPSSPIQSSGTSDLFGGDLFASNPTFNNSAPAHMNNSFDILGSSSSNNGSSSFFDIMGNQPTNPVPLQAMPLQQNSPIATQKSDDIFGEFFTKPSTAAVSKPNQQQQSSKESATQNKSALWNDLSGSLDLDNLLSTKPKQSLSINEMKNKQGMSGSNSFM
uniref:ENTH domain-containing protein n=1 Tax=Panagrolaimus superbus TaxID=310955 RepID=A0A914XW91_9BILA